MLFHNTAVSYLYVALGNLVRSAFLLFLLSSFPKSTNEECAICIMCISPDILDSNSYVANVLDDGSVYMLHVASCCSQFTLQYHAFALFIVLCTILFVVTCNFIVFKVNSRHYCSVAVSCCWWCRHLVY